MSDRQILPIDYQALFEKSARLCLVLDPQLRIVAVTDAYCRATLTKREEILGRGIFEVFPDDETRSGADGASNLRESLERVLRLKRPDTMAMQRYDVKRPDGKGFEEKYWNSRNSPILDDSGNVSLIVHRVYDVTSSMLTPDTDAARDMHRKSQDRLIIELQRVNSEMAQLDTLRSSLMHMSRLHTVAMMASALAHDVSQPLTAAQNYLGALQRDVSLTPDTAAFQLITKLGVQIERAGNTVKGLRKFIAAGRVVQSAENLESVVGEATLLAETVTKQSRATVTTDIPKQIPKVLIDRLQIQQVLVNLIANAAEAVRGQSNRRIMISAEKLSNAVRIDVSDSGKGLSPEMSSELFEPFRTTKEEGLGLGLPICRHILEEHGGRLWLSKSDSTGTVFSFTLPLAPQRRKGAPGRRRRSSK